MSITLFLLDAFTYAILYNFQVFRVAYCLPFSDDTAEEYLLVCQKFVYTIREHKPQFLKKQKIHMLLHLVECMRDFGPCAGFNTERYDYTVHVYVH